MADATNIVVCGSGGTGKTALIMRFLKENFMDEYEPTIESSYTKVFGYDGADYNLEITDTSGREEYNQLRDASLRKADGFLVVYAVDSLFSFDELDVHLAAIAKAQETEKFPLVLAGNKADVDESKFQAKDEVVEKKSISLNCPWIEVSAKKNDKVDECFSLLMQQIYHPNQYKRKKLKKKTEDGKDKGKEKGGGKKKDKKRRGCVIQ